MSKKKLSAYILAAVCALTMITAPAAFAETSEAEEAAQVQAGEQTAAQEGESGDSGSSGSEAAEGARTAEDVQNGRCYINGDEIRAFQTESGVFVAAKDLASYGFSVEESESGMIIEWAGTDYRFDNSYTPDTDDDAMPYVENIEKAGSCLLAGEEAALYTINEIPVIKAEDLGRLGFCEYDEEKDMTNIYISAAGYEPNDDQYRIVTVDAGTVTGEILRQNGAHRDPDAPGSDKNNEYQESGIVSMRTHDISPRPGSPGTIYTLCPGYFKNHSGLNFIPIFMQELTEAATALGKLEGTGEMPEEDWLADARLGNLHANAQGEDPDRNAKIEEILNNDAYPYAMDALEKTMEECRENMGTIDVTDDELYDFEAFDRVIDNFLSLGATVYFRFGASGEDIIDNKFPECGTEEWELLKENLGKIAVKICDHYMNSEKYQNALAYFEIWNEPDLLDFWPNTAQHYYEMYDVVSKAVKNAYPELPVGGPTITTENDDRGTRESFLAYVVEHECPLDFYSYHFYPSNNIDAYDYARFAFEYRELLDEYGFEDTPVILSEYGTALFSQFSQFINTDHRAAIHLLNNCIYLQDSPVILNYTYNGVGDPKSDQDIAFKAMAALYDTAGRLAVTGADKNGFAVLAGKNEDTIKIIISNYEVPAEQMLRNFAPENLNPMMDGNKFSIPDVANWTLPAARVLTYKNNAGYQLTVKNVPYTGTVSVEQYRIDADNALDLIDSFEAEVSENGAVEISMQLPVYSADLLVIRQK